MSILNIPIFFISHFSARGRQVSMLITWFLMHCLRNVAILVKFINMYDIIIWGLSFRRKRVIVSSFQTERHRSLVFVSFISNTFEMWHKRMYLLFISSQDSNSYLIKHHYTPPPPLPRFNTYFCIDPYSLD